MTPPGTVFRLSCGRYRGDHWQQDYTVSGDSSQMVLVTLFTAGSGGGGGGGRRRRRNASAKEADEERRRDAIPFGVCHSDQMKVVWVKEMNTHAGYKIIRAKNRFMCLLPVGL